MSNQEYQIIVEHLSAEDGGGFLARVPDLPGCMSDGETRAQAIANVEDAIAVWIDAAGRMGRPAPRPTPVRQYA